jgi:hypothetical protein
MQVIPKHSRKVQMPKKEVFLAPVPAAIIDSALSVPSLSELVAFGSNKAGLDAIAVGTDVYIYASQPPHSLWRAGVVTWCGTLGGVVPAVETGRRSGKHPNPAARPPLAETDDTAVTHFWEVRNLHRLQHPIPFSRFENADGRKVFGGSAPEWPTVAFLDDKAP